MENNPGEIPGPRVIRSLSPVAARDGDRFAAPEKAPEAYDALQFDNRYARDMFPNVRANLKRLYRMGAVIGAGTDIGGTATGFFRPIRRRTEKLRCRRHSQRPRAQDGHVDQREDSRPARPPGERGKGKVRRSRGRRRRSLKDLGVLAEPAMVMNGGVFLRTPSSSRAGRTRREKRFV